MMTREEALAYGMSFYNVYEEKPFRDPNWQLVRIKGSKKTFLWIYEREGYINLNVKVNPEWRDFWRSAYESVTAGYHLNKEHWNTIILDGTIPEEEIKRMIAESYDLVTDSPTKRIYEAVKRIPKGHVATYGKIAEMAGEPRMARAVGNALHKNPDPEHIPCFRVVNAKGELAGAFAFGGQNVQAELLRADGVEVINGRVDLEKYGIGITSFSPLSQGLLTGKYKKGQPYPEGSRATHQADKQINNLLTDENLAIVDELSKVADDLGTNVAILSLAWILKHPEISCVIAGASKPSQLENNLKAVDLEIPDDAMERIEKILGFQRFERHVG